MMSVNRTTYEHNQNEALRTEAPLDPAIEIENNIRELRRQSGDFRQAPDFYQDQIPPSSKTPLELIAGSFQILTYGMMMQFAQELKQIGMGSAETPEQVAAALHEWALNHGQIEIQKETTPLNPTTTTGREEDAQHITKVPEVTLTYEPLIAVGDAGGN